MRTFGAELTGHALPAAACRVAAAAADVPERGAFRAEEQRRARLLTELRKARLTGIRVPVPAEALQARLSGLPAGVLVEPGRIEVRYAGAKEALTRLYALAQALVNDFEDFEALVGGERTSKDRD